MFETKKNFLKSQNRSSFSLPLSPSPIQCISSKMTSTLPPTSPHPALSLYLYLFPPPTLVLGSFPLPSHPLPSRPSFPPCFAFLMFLYVCCCFFLLFLPSYPHSFLVPSPPPSSPHTQTLPLSPAPRACFEKRTPFFCGMKQNKQTNKTQHPHSACKSVLIRRREGTTIQDVHAVLPPPPPPPSLSPHTQLPPPPQKANKQSLSTQKCTNGYPPLG